MKKKAADTGQRSLLQFFNPTKQNGEPLKELDSNAQQDDNAEVVMEKECIEVEETAPAKTSPVKTDAPLAKEAPPTVTAASPSPLAEANEKEMILDISPQDPDAHPPQIQEEETVEEDISTEDEGQGEEHGVEAMQHAAITTEGGPLAYELEREARIRRNMEVMRSLGLGAGGSASLQVEAPKTNKKLRPAAQRKRPLSVSTGGPVRRSSRHRGDSTNGSSLAENTTGALQQEPEEEEQQEEEEMLEFDDSSVKKYVCEVLNLGCSDGLATINTTPPPGASVRSFNRLPGLLVDPALARAYSVDWRPGLVVAGGKNGHVSVWGSRALENNFSKNFPKDSSDYSAEGAVASISTSHNEDNEQEETEIEPLMSLKLHKGWISDVQFCGSGTGGGDGSSEIRLITAGNDGIVNLWDITQSATHKSGRREVTQCLSSAKDLHSSGIFSMHEVGGRVLTGSKDCSVVLSSIDASGGITLIRRWDDLHNGVVKCARWRPVLGISNNCTAESSVFASCGKDGVVQVVDVRAPENQTTSIGSGTEIQGAGNIVIHGGHSTAVNSVRWSPASEHLLLSASHDPHILLHDLRNPKESLHAFKGHSSAHRLKGIIQPVFVAGGEAVATGGEKGDVLSLYRVSDGSTISRGATDMNIGATFCGAGEGDPMLCTANRCVAFYLPVWE